MSQILRMIGLKFSTAIFTMQAGDTLYNDTGSSYVVSIMPSSPEAHMALLAQLKALLGEPEEVYGNNVWG